MFPGYQKIDSRGLGETGNSAASTGKDPQHKRSPHPSSAGGAATSGDSNLDLSPEMRFVVRAKLYYTVFYRIIAKWRINDIQ